MLHLLKTGSKISQDKGKLSKNKLNFHDPLSLTHSRLLQMMHTNRITVPTFSTVQSFFILGTSRNVS